MSIIIITFIAAFALIGALGVMVFSRDVAARRLFSLIVSPPEVMPVTRVAVAPRGERIRKLVQPFQGILPRNEGEVSKIRKRLVGAGYREDAYVNIFYGVRVLTPLILCLLVTVTGLYRLSPLFMYVTAGGIGFIAPDFALSRRIAARQLKIRLGLPEALDLIVICVEAGLSLDKAVARTAEELQLSQREMADELNLVNLELRAGCSRVDAWIHCADRTGVDSVREFASILIQADKFGTSVGKALRAHSETLRVQRQQAAEERAAKTTVKLVFPLVLFIFPSLFVVTLGPSMIVMFAAFDQYLK